MEKLNQIQKEIVETSESKVLVVSAAAAGKTQTLIERIRFLLESGVDASGIVAITFTNNAASVIYERLGYPNGLFVGTVHSYCNYLLRGGSVETFDLIEQEKFDDLFLRIEENQSCLKHVTHLIVDEAQDSTDLQFKFFELINPDNFMYFCDYRQSIYGFSGANPQYIFDLMARPQVCVYKMRQNYRNTAKILHFAKKFLFRLGPSYEDDSIPMRGDSGVGVVEGDITPSEAVSLLIRYNEKLNSHWGDWFVLCRTNADIELFSKLFNDVGVPTDTFKQADLSNSEIKNKIKEDTVKILTVHSVKGMEAPNVLAFNIRAYNDEEARLCYVAATRARDFLIWARMPKKSKKKSKIANWE